MRKLILALLFVLTLTQLTGCRIMGRRLGEGIANTTAGIFSGMFSSFSGNR